MVWGLVNKNRKNLLWVCERLDASRCYKWLCLLVSKLTIRQIHSYQHPPGSHTQRTINRRYAQKQFSAQDNLNSLSCTVVLHLFLNDWRTDKKHIRFQEWKKCFLGLSSLLLFIAWKAVSGLGAWEWKLAYIRRHTKQQHERRRSERTTTRRFFRFLTTNTLSNQLKPNSNHLSNPNQTISNPFKPQNYFPI